MLILTKGGGGMKLKIAAAAAAGMIAGSAVTGAAPVRFSVTQTSAADYSSDELRNYAYKVVELINVERAANGLAPLKISAQINEASLLRAGELVTEFSHYRPNGTACFSVISEMGISYMAVAENIACGQTTPEEAVSCWMNSDGHRANILNSAYEFTGVGVIQQGGVYYWSQFFISSPDLTEETPAGTPVPEPEPEPEPIIVEPEIPPVILTEPPTEPPTAVTTETAAATAPITTTAPPKPKSEYKQDYALRVRTYMTNYFRIYYDWDMSGFYGIDV